MFLLTINTNQSIPSSKRWFTSAHSQLENATYLFITFRYSVDNTVNIDRTNPVPKPLLSQIEEAKLEKIIFHLF